MSNILLATAFLTTATNLTGNGFASDPVFERQMDKTVYVVQAPIAERMQGRVVTSTGTSGLADVKVTLLDPDGAILDVTITSSNGKFELDLGVLDEANLEAIKSLYLEFATRTKTSKQIKVADLMRSYSRTVQLREIKLN